jgi:hypothetical protein
MKFFKIHLALFILLSINLSLFSQPYKNHTVFYQIDTLSVFPAIGYITCKYEKKLDQMIQ